MTGTVDRGSPPSPGPIRPVRFPAVHRKRLDNGLTVLSARHGDLPLVTARLVVDAGAAAEPDAKAGLARLTAAALETGTADRSADEIAWAFERLGVEVDAVADWDATTLQVTVPRERLESAVALLSELARQPAFPAGEVERLRDEQRAAILQRRTEPRALADDMANRFVFAPGVPYARPLAGTLETVEPLDRDDAEAFYRSRFLAGAAALLLVGDIDDDDAVELADRHFGAWTSGRPDRPDFDVAPAIEETTVIVVDRPGAVQSELRIGHVGVARDHEDYFPLIVMNTILGGSFTSRLNMSLRERYGFTYGARSRFAFRRRPGPFVVQTAVATEVTGKAVQHTLRELAELQGQGASDDEVASARDYLRGVLPLQLQTTGQLSGRLAELVTYGLSDDYYDRYRDRVAAVTTDDVARVARRHLHLDRLAVVVVGDADSVAPELEQLDIGPVRVEEPA